MNLICQGSEKMVMGGIIGGRNIYPHWLEKTSHSSPRRAFLTILADDLILT